ncbi:hypothetical protein [Arthrobacter terrae]|nr:hypothetical protein [Arthrobacter terrae]
MTRLRQDLTVEGNADDAQGAANVDSREWVVRMPDARPSPAS